MEEVWEDIREPKKAKRHVLRFIHKRVLRLNFYRIHMGYFIVVIAISSVIVYGEGLANASKEIEGTKLRYVDALFLCTSAMTTTGLNTVNLGDLTVFQQFVLFVLMTIGNVIFVSMFVVIVRLYYFRRKLSKLVEHSKAGRKILEDIKRQVAQKDAARAGEDSENAGESSSRQHDSGGRSGQEARKRKGDRAMPEDPKPWWLHADPPPPYSPHQSGLGGLPWPWQMQSIRNAVRFKFRKPKEKHVQKQNQRRQSYLSFEPQLDERGRFVQLSEHERAEIGGIEYRSLVALIWLLVAYQLFWLGLGIVFLTPYAYRSSVKQIIHDSQPGYLNPGWWAVFTAQESFANGGLNPLNANFVPFSTNYYILIIAMFLTVAGQTHFPIFLRWIIHVLAKVSPEGSRAQETFVFLLEHPRRCFIYLFPESDTWQLLAIQLVIDLTAWVLFEILNIGISDVESIPVGARIFDGLFQSVGLRTSGSYIITIGNLAPGLLVAYLVAMYISSFPLVMALRQTNAYEESSIGLDRGQHGGGLIAHIRLQLAYDIWFQILAWFLISIIQRHQLETAQPGFTLFSLLFEVTSAYGTVGLSMGVPNVDYSLCGNFYTLSKVIMMAVMIRGRHRGLPYAIDRAVLIPGEKLMRRMDEEYNRQGHFSKGDEDRVLGYEDRSGVPQMKGGKEVEQQDPEQSEEQEQNQAQQQADDENSDEQSEEQEQNQAQQGANNENSDEQLLGNR